MLQFPLEDLLDGDACYRMLLSMLHPGGLRCPAGHELPEDQAPHDRHREPVVDYRCRTCGKVSNILTGTPLQGVRHPPERLVLILRGFCQGVPTLHLAQELGISGRHLLPLWHRVLGLALERFPPSALEPPTGGRVMDPGQRVPASPLLGTLEIPALLRCHLQRPTGSA